MSQGRVRQPDALPLQHEPRKSGNAIFLNPLHPQLAPLPDDQQWNHLASAHRLERLTVERIVEDATRRGGVIGLRLPELEDETVRKPWMRSPSGTVPVLPIAGPLPSQVRAVLGQRLFVEKAGLPSPLAGSDQAAGRLPESRVLQEAEPAALDGADPARDCLRGRPTSTHRTSPRLSSRSRRLTEGARHLARGR